MTARDEKGRFVRADAQPVLHRQVEAKSPHAWPQAEHLHLDDIWEPEPQPSRWPWVFLIVSLILVAVMGTWLAAVDGGLVP